VKLLDPVLDRASPVPLYFQVAQHLEAAIAGGALQVGDRLENEVALAERWGLSRPTMRQAIGYLVDKGLLVRQRGVGTEVVRQHVQRPLQLTSLYDDLRASGQQPTTEVLLHGREPADDVVAARLGVPVGTEVVKLERLRRAQGAPLAILRSWLPVPVAGSIEAGDLRENGLYACLRASGTTIHSAEQRIGARAASPEEAALLDLRRGAPLLTMERTAFDQRARAIEWGSHVYDARAHSFTVTLLGE
jgi:DNA-binding GntR family transcriptional regulator